MKQVFLPLLAACLFTAGIHAPAHAQKKKKQKETSSTTITATTDSDNIIIRRSKGDKTGNFSIDIKGASIYVNGKKLEGNTTEIDGAKIEIRKSPSGSEFLFNGAPLANFNNFSFTTDSLVFNMENLFSGNRAQLGVSTTADDKGARVSSLVANGAAEKAGIKSGDIITHIDEKAISASNTLSQVIGKYKPDAPVKVKVIRDKKEHTIPVILGKANNLAITNGFGSINTFNDALRLNRNTVIDAERAARNAERSLAITGYGVLGRVSLGVAIQETEEDNGVKILSVEKEGAAEKAGLKEGDIITQANETEIKNNADISTVMRGQKAGDTLVLRILRNGSWQHISVKFPKTLRTTNL